MSEFASYASFKTIQTRRRGDNKIKPSEIIELSLNVPALLAIWLCFVFSFNSRGQVDNMIVMIKCAMSCILTLTWAFDVCFMCVKYEYRRASMARTGLGCVKFVLARGSSSYPGLVFIQDPNPINETSAGRVCVLLFSFFNFSDRRSLKKKKMQVTA